MKALPEYFIKLFINEAFRYRKPIAYSFIAILGTLTFIGLIWPKGYTVSTTILVDDRNIIRPLMQGAAVPTEVTDRARITREIVYGRKIMNQILSEMGWLTEQPDAEEQDRLLKELIKHTKVTNIGQNLIKVEYEDDDPQRAYRTTARFAELFISESAATKSAESQAAFEFIDKQVVEYHGKLSRAEEALKEFRSANLDAQPGTDADISARLNTLQSRIEEATRELRETEIKKISLEKQLSGEAETASALSRESQFRSRIAELQTQLETLRLSYHDNYPDIVRLRHQISDLNEAIANERQRHAAARASGRSVIDESVVNNPMYQQLRRDLSQTQIQIDTLQARIAQAKQQLQSELERGKRMQGGAATLAELTRDYQVNREIYQDLLRRRENARVSMNLDRENQGLTFKVQEPATLPLQPSGLRFWHYVVIGFVLGLAVPLGALYAKLQIDARVRVPSALAERYKLPLLGSVPQLWSPAEIVTVRRDVRALSIAIGVTLFVVVSVSILRFVRVI